MLHRASIAWFAALLVPALVFIACATGVTQVGLGAGGNGGDGTDTTAVTGSVSTASFGVVSSGASSSSSGVPTTCTVKADCAGLDNACNTGNCVNAMCARAPINEGGVCDDGMFCTEIAACTMGLCVATSMKDCPPPDSCHVGACDEAMKACGSAPGNDGASCDDGDPCTYSGTCSGGTCTAGPPVDCTNLDSPCADGVCDPMLGCTAKAKNDGAACDDMLYCTINDQCTAGVCSGVPNTCAPPGDVCMVGQCNEVSKSCVAVPGNNGVSCSDGNPCHVNATCSAGTCANGVAGNAGKACNDGNACDVGATCNGGVCGNPASKIAQCIGGDMCCPPACTIANDSDCKPPCGGYVDPNIGGCWYLSPLGGTCTATCAAHGGFNAVKAQHLGNPICKHFYPAKTDGDNWVTIECCSTDNNTNWGADDTTPDPTFTNANCYLACACDN